MTRWIREIPISYRAHFQCLITLICLTQSFRSFAWMGIFYQMKDKLRLSIPASHVLVSTAFLPWSVKPIFGFMSDNNTPNGLGNRRLSYLIVSSTLSLLPWISLAQTAPTRASYIYLAILLTTQNIGAAMVDVVVDAVVTEAARVNRLQFNKSVHQLFLKVQIRIGALQPLLWLAIAFGGILGCICGGLGVVIFNLESVFLLFSLFPILQLFACGLLGEQKLGQLDERDYDVQEAVGDAPVDVDYYGMLNSFIEEEGYLDTIMLQALAKERRAVLRLPWSSGEGTHALDEKRENDHRDEEDWIQIGQNGQEKEEVVLDATPVCKDHGPEIFTMDANGLDLIEELDLMEMEELQRHTEQLDAEACGRPGAVEGRGLWQELQATVSDILKQPAIMQPLLWFLITQLVTPNLSSIMLCCRSPDNSEARASEATFLGASPMISWGGLMLSTFLFNHYLKHIHLRKVKLW